MAPLKLLYFSIRLVFIIIIIIIIIFIYFFSFSLSYFENKKCCFGNQMKLNTFVCLFIFS